MPLTADSQIKHADLPSPFHHAGHMLGDIGMFIRPLALQLLRNALYSHTAIPRTVARVESLVRITGREDSRSFPHWMVHRLSRCGHRGGELSGTR